jgi:hypothetical protein
MSIAGEDGVEYLLYLKKDNLTARKWFAGNSI